MKHHLREREDAMRSNAAGQPVAPVTRRCLLRAALGAAAALPLAACGGTTSTSPGPGTTVSSSAAAGNAKATGSAASSGSSSTVAAAPAGSNTHLVFLSRGDVHSQAVFKESITNFQKAHPDITVENQPVVDNFDQKLETMLAGNVAPDVFFGMAATFLVYPAKGETVELDSYANRATDFKKDDYYPYWLSTMQWKGKLVALPYDPDMVVIYYNKALFDKAQLAYPDAKTPMNWDQLLTLAEQLTLDRKGNRGPAVDRSQIVQYGLDPFYNRMWWHLPREYGIDVFNADFTRTNLDQSAAVDALQTLVNFGQKYHVTTTPDSGTDQPINFQSNSLAMVINGGWQRGLYLQQVKNPWDIAPMPQVAGKQPVNMGWASGLMITKQSKHAEQGWQFLAYLAGKEGQQLLLKESVNQPMLKSLADDPAFTSPPEPAHKEVLLNEVESGKAPPYIPAYLEIQTAVQSDLLDPTLTGKQTVQTAIAAVVPKINAILDTYHKQFGE